MDVSSFGSEPTGNRRAPWRKLEGWRQLAKREPGSIRLELEGLGRDDLDAEAHFAPLLVARRLRRVRLVDRRDRHAGGAVAQVDQYAAAVLLEIIERRT